MIRAVAVEGYRSLRSLYVPLGRLTVVTGGNGSGKSSLYRVLSLLAAAARGDLVPALAREGGLSSTAWAGPERISGSMRRGEHLVQGTVRQSRVALRIGIAGDDLGYAVDLGLPLPGTSMFQLDPEIKVEAVWSGPRLRPATLLAERRGPMVRTRGADGDWEVLPVGLATFDSMLATLADPRAAPEVLAVREGVRSWRFYDQVRTDPGSPARARAVATRTPSLPADGYGLASALQTILEIGDAEGLADAVAGAFPGSTLEITPGDGVLDLGLRQPGLLRPLAAAELSDGTLRYLIWAAALLSPRPPAFLVLNEPENSLHPDLLPALARLVTGAAGRGQVMVVSHSAALVARLRAAAEAAATPLAEVRLVKDTGETRVEDQGSFEGASWVWPKR